jgi:hypothetical protein
VIRRLAVVAVLAALAFAGLELAVRAAGYSAPFWYRPDAQVGWTLRPGTQGWFIKEGGSYVRANAAGFRDRDHTLDKPDGVYRIAVLGDEHSEAMQVTLAETWWALLGERLASCGFAGAKTIEMLNFGLTGFGTGQEYALLESVAMRYQPDLVLLQFTGGNDAQNNSFALAEEKDRPFYRLDAQGRLRLDDSYASEPHFLRHAALSHELVRRAADRSRALQWLSMIPEGVLIRRAEAAGFQAALLAPPRDALWEEAWRTTEALVLKARDYAARNGARFALVTVPEAIALDRARRDAVQAKLGVADLFYPERRIAAFAAAHGIPAIALGPEMDKAAGAPLYFRSLWNPAGERLAAEIVAQRLCGG